VGIKVAFFGGLKIGAKFSAESGSRFTKVSKTEAEREGFGDTVKMSKHTVCIVRQGWKK